jgi:dTDP-4-dehydrorhamnose reductase
MARPTPRILLTGSNGQVGRALRQTLAPLGDVLALDHRGLDLANADEVRSTVRRLQPTLIVNAGAYTAVDRAESEPELAMSVNGVAPGVLAEEAKLLGAVLVHYSTDYVFDGSKPGTYVETDAPNPLNVYGRSKLAGEQAIQASCDTHYILRTSWVYSAAGANFLNTILRLADERPELRIVNDQTGAPTWAESIAEMTAEILTSGIDRQANPRYGLYHLTATGTVTWFGFAEAILAEAKKVKSEIPETKLIPITTLDYPLPAKRPLNSMLDNTLLSKTFGIVPASWQDMLSMCLQRKWKQ